MEKLARSRSRYMLFISLAVLFSSCRLSSTETASIQRTFVATDHAGWHYQDGRLFLRNKPFSGWQYKLWPTGDTAFVGAFSQGKAEGTHRYWYANGQQKEKRHYQDGWQESEQQGWFESGKSAFFYHFQHDVYEGNQKEWYANGQLAQEKNYHKGQENGTERMWFADGSLKANYVVRNGRHYGFTGVKNCVNVKDSISVLY